MHQELIDRFGQLPVPAHALLDSHRLRIMAKPLGIIKVDASADAIAEFSCARNLNLSYQSGKKREIDVFFLINKTRPLYIECKTGEFRQDLDKYVALRKRLGIEQKYFILCVADLDTEQSKGQSAMHGMTFVNVQTLGQHLSTLI